MVGNEGIVGERAIFEGGLPMVRCSMLTDGRPTSSGAEVETKIHEAANCTIW
jgi:hypothetical protein